MNFWDLSEGCESGRCMACDYIKGLSCPVYPKINMENTIKCPNCNEKIKITWEDMLSWNIDLR